MNEIAEGIQEDWLDYYDDSNEKILMPIDCSFHNIYSLTIPFVLDIVAVHVMLDSYLSLIVKQMNEFQFEFHITYSLFEQFNSLTMKYERISYLIYN